MSPATFSWSLLEKRTLPKFVNLSLRRGINSNTALSPKIQTSPILAQGIRIARKCNRIKQFISSYSNYLIEWLTEHDSTIYYHTIYRNIHRALNMACQIHIETWKFTELEMQDRLSRKIRGQLHNRSTPQQKHRIMLLLKMRQLSDYQPSASPSAKKRLRIQPCPLNPPRKCQRPTIAKTPTLIPNMTLPLPWPDAAVPDPANTTYLQDDDEDQKLAEPPSNPN